MENEEDDEGRTDCEYDVYTEAFGRTAVAAKIIVKSHTLLLAFAELFDLSGAKSGALAFDRACMSID